MRVMFISLLLSITIGNILYAMEDADVNEKTFIEVVTNGAPRRSDRFSKSISSSSSNSPTTIKTLDGMRQLSRQILTSRPNECENGPLDQEEFKIPDDITIDLQVFVEYAYREGLVIKSEPGICKCWICCSPKIKNQFEDVNFTASREWGKKILEVIPLLNGPTKATTEGVEDFTIVNDAVTGRVASASLSAFSWVSNNNEQQDDNDSGLTVDVLKKQLKELKTKAELDKEMNGCLVEQQRKEERRSRRKEIFFGAVALVIVGFGTYFGTNFFC